MWRGLKDRPSQHFRYGLEVYTHKHSFIFRRDAKWGEIWGEGSAPYQKIVEFSAPQIAYSSAFRIQQQHLKCTN